MCLRFVNKNLDKYNCFGLSDEQYTKLKKQLNEAFPNHNKNNFPDFLFDGGFIEHFAVTSSSEDRKGAQQRRESNRFRNRSEDNFLRNLDNNQDKVFLSKSYNRRFESHSHYNIIKSVKKNWSKHIESYDRTGPISKEGIFLIEYIDMNIETAILKKNELANVYETYRMSVDKHLLEWIYKYKEKVKYVIFVSIPLKSIEVIRIDNIPEILKGIPNVIYSSVEGFESHKYINITF